MIILYNTPARFGFVEQFHHWFRQHFQTGVGCLYSNKLEDIDLKVLQQMIETALKGK